MIQDWIKLGSGTAGFFYFFMTKRTVEIQDQQAPLSKLQTNSKVLKIDLLTHWKPVKRGPAQERDRLCFRCQ